jgi:hypothetical protein
MSKITVTVYKDGLQKEAELSKLTGQIQKHEGLNYHNACTEAERRFNPVAYNQITHSESLELDLMTLGEHIAKGSPFKIHRD